ncbi:MAG TPA: glycosyltransferase family 2 protein [Polyangiaceae bacterium LLY-WYZ-15_(1-7)]|nr:hypothetical protein [Sandaracinus sp.]HJL03772.1 glycosyltransferase family 2 protein [Polyangiaceae bacterium LLY-WYZ-15_(1-7)]MBJ74017.1 hypothetical protein [Sandaracinus sp.]HJL09827.1 glycosyltransferase family 2 protein [Polyangiaceae bacterium LLY-WYZ-15_(1-7)]HJL21594.1 glycosyltransferase family 2 protein [Polyangiaceae bacterium LLY-WYZ-15_(1-7)]
MNGDRPEISICAPAYDEEACIEEVVRSWLAMLDGAGIAGEVVVADDGSRDGTRAILARLAAEDARVRVVGEAVNRGYGPALRSAIAAARGAFVATIDSDGQFDPADVPRLLAHQRRGGFDLVNGWRRKRDTPARVAADLGLRALVRALFGVRVHDPNCALKLMRARWVQEAVREAALEARGFPTPSEVVIRAQRDGLAIGELPVTHRERAGGQTKLRLARTALDAARFFVALRIRLGSASG